MRRLLLSDLRAECHFCAAWFAMLRQDYQRAHEGAFLGFGLAYSK